MADDVPATNDELLELLLFSRELIVELEKNRDLLKAHVSRLETANTELATVNANLASEVQMLRDAHHDD